MCISVAVANFSNTHLYAGEAEHEGKYVHVMGYQNQAASDGPNAMLLPIPTNEPMGPDNLVDTREFKQFMENIAQASRSKRMRRSRGLTKGIDSVAASYQVFDSGSYTVALADSVAGIKQSLEAVPETKRPELSFNLLSSLGNLYKGWKWALCCWEGEIKAEPILLWYVPKRKDLLFAPALDSHDGNAPDLGAKVSVDHYVSFGTMNLEKGNPVIYSQKKHHLLPDQVFGTKLVKQFYNGDFIASIDDVANRKMYRSAPVENSRKEKIKLLDWE